MRRRVLLCLTLISLSACNGDTVVKPTASPASPTNAISDATHSALGYTSNPDFFFLPPMVGSPSGSPQWDAGAFNASLRPTVEICASSALTETAVATSPCTPMPPALAAAADAGAEQYQVNWKVPTSSTIFYRITVKVGQTTLGFADVETASNMSQLKNVATGDFIPLSDGRTLPIKFRIERYALCAVPGVGPCTSGSGDIAVAPLTVQTGTPTTSADGISTAVGVTIPQQTGSTTSTPVTVTISSCPNLNPAVIDLPTFGECVRVTTDPVLPRLTDPATVFICAVGINASLFAGLSESQEALVTLHRYDASGPNAGVTSLPHAPACKPGTPGGVLASAGPSLRGMLADVAHGRIKHAASQVIALLAPKPLYAARFIDLGGGGETSFFSDFQFALPAKMEIVQATNNQTAAPGTVLSPTVKVTDLGGEPVAGAVVHFNTSDPSVAPGTPVTTGADGLATTPWTIVAGNNVLPASGRGIASPSVNGPRRTVGSEIDDINDPFQPIQRPFDPGFDGKPSAVSVLTGSVSFTATGFSGEIVVLNDFNPFQIGFLDDPANGGGNRAFVRNLANVTGSGPRAQGTGILMDSGHGSAFPSCFSDAALAEMNGNNPAIPYPPGGLADLPASIKVVILCLPTVAYSDQEIDGLRRFAAEGGRIIYVAEYGRRSPSLPPFGGDDVINRENDFLTVMGAAARNIGEGVDCGYALLPAASIRAHPLTAGVTSLSIACSSVLSLGANDAALFYDTSNSKVLAGVVKVGAPPVIFAARAAALTATTEKWTSQYDGAGNLINP